MANLPSVDIVAMLAADGVGAVGSTLFYNKLPQGFPLSAPVAVVYDSGGYDAEAAGVVFDKPTVMVQVTGRDSDHAGAMALAASVQNALHQRAPETINAARYLGIWQVGGISFVGYDEQNRPAFSLNFRVHRTY